MSKVYDNWERLVAAVLDREKLRDIALCDSLNSDFSTDRSSGNFSVSSPLRDGLEFREISELEGMKIEVLNGVNLFSLFLDFCIHNLVAKILPSPLPKFFTFNELRDVTRNFQPSAILGEGGFGNVYKGWINGLPVAVKKLKPDSFQGHNEWLTEVNYLGKIHHPNIVKLIGYCLEGKYRLLVYEFMSKGSLDKHLFKRPLTWTFLTWATRMKVAIGSARSLSFLHEAEEQVIYRNFKASNILLDQEFIAKLSDFDSAIAAPTGGRTHVKARVMGTYGYIAPEYVAKGHLTAKSDVYGFGVVLLELLSGRPAVDKISVGIEQKLVEWAKPYMRDNRKLFRIMDMKLEGQYPQEAAFAATTLALHCLDNDPKMRPSMAEVVAALERLSQPSIGEPTETRVPGKIKKVLDKIMWSGLKQ